MLNSENSSSKIHFKGVGVHSNKLSEIVCSQNNNQGGIRFILKKGLKDIVIPCNIDNLSESQFQINLTNGTHEVNTVEHLLSSFYGLCLQNIDVQITSLEVPIMDGSAIIFSKKLQQFSKQEIEQVLLPQAVMVGDEHRYIIALPHDKLVIHSIIQFDHSLIQKQRYDFVYSRESYLKEIAPARTFGFLDEWEKLKQNGYALGSTPENTLIFTHDKIYNPPLRFKNEPVRHKILDFIAVLPLLRNRLNMEVFCFCSGHNLDIQFIKLVNRLLKNPNYLKPDLNLIETLIHKDFF